MSRLMIIDPGVELWGSEKALLNTLPALTKHHNECLLIVPFEAELAKPAKEQGIHVEEQDIGLLHKRSRLYRAFTTLKLVVRALIFQPDIIYVNQAGFCHIAQKMAQACGARLVLHIRIREDIARCESIRASKRAPVDIIHITKAMEALYQEQHPAHKRSFMAYDCYEAELITPITGEERPNVQTKFICAGRIAPLKGLDYLIEQFALLIGRDVEAQLQIAGSASQHPQYLTELEGLVQRHNLSDQVHFLGYRSEMENLMRQSDVLVSASKFEPLGRTILEGWEAGCICIADKASGGAAEIISHSGGGFVFDREKADDLCAILQKTALLTTKQRKAMNLQGREWMYENVSIQAYVKALKGCLFN